MPTYTYKCDDCDSVFEYFHSYKVKKTTCESCGQDSLKKMLNTPINIAKKAKTPKSTPGRVIKKTIEETKKEMIKDKEKLKRRQK